MPSPPSSLTTSSTTSSPPASGEGQTGGNQPTQVRLGGGAPVQMTQQPLPQLGREQLRDLARVLEETHTALTPQSTAPAQSSLARMMGDPTTQYILQTTVGAAAPALTAVGSTLFWLGESQARGQEHRQEVMTSLERGLTAVQNMPKHEPEPEVD